MFIATQSSNVSSDHQVVCGQCKLGLRGLESWQPQPMDPEVLAKAQVMATKVTGALIPKTCCDASVEVFCLSRGGKNDGCALRILRSMQELKTQESLLPPANVADERGGRADAAGRRVTQD